DMVQAVRGVGSQVEERTDARYILVRRERLEGSDRTMILHDEIWHERGGELLPVPRRDGPPEAQSELPGASVGRGLAREVEGVEMGVGGVEVVGVERHDRYSGAVVVDLGDLEELDLARAAVAVERLQEPPAEDEPVTPGGDRLLRES